MCRRYASFLPAEALRRTFRTTNPLPNIKPSWNVAPTQSAPVVLRHPETGERHLDLLEWGLLRWWQKDTKRSRPINVHAERLVARRGMFQGAFAYRRALVPADAFYEWKVIEDGEQAYAIARQDGQPMAFAGLWEEYRFPDWRVLRTFAIVTTAANAETAEVRDRMPVILEPADWPAWLGEMEGDPASLLHPVPDGTLHVWPVDRRVGSPRNNGPELLEPIALPGQAGPETIRQPAPAAASRAASPPASSSARTPIGFQQGLSTSRGPSAAVQDPASAAARRARAPDAALNDATPAALAVAWRELVLAAEEPGMSKEDSEALVERADVVLDRMAETPAVTAAALAAKLLVWNCEADGGETVTGMRLRASIVSDAQGLAGPELADIMPDPIPTEPRGLVDEARERGAVWAREHVLRPHRLLGAVPAASRLVVSED